MIMILTTTMAKNFERIIKSGNYDAAKVLSDIEAARVRKRITDAEAEYLNGLIEGATTRTKARMPPQSGQTKPRCPSQLQKEGSTPCETSTRNQTSTAAPSRQRTRPAVSRRAAPTSRVGWSDVRDDGQTPLEEVPLTDGLAGSQLGAYLVGVDEGDQPDNDTQRPQGGAAQHQGEDKQRQPLHGLPQIDLPDAEQQMDCRR